jgi:hypothetical protein
VPSGGLFFADIFYSPCRYTGQQYFPAMFASTASVVGVPHSIGEVQ